MGCRFPVTCVTVATAERGAVLITRREVLLLAPGAASGAGARAEQGGPTPLHIVTAHLPPLVWGRTTGQPAANSPGPCANSWMPCADGSASHWTWNSCPGAAPCTSRARGYERLVEASSIDEVHRFLLAGMADAAFGERAIIHRSLSLRGEEKNFHLGRPVRTTTAWLAGSRDIGEPDAARWHAAMAELVADGTQKRIFRHYGLA
jgi:hypothetical protein